jgi:hypothetical protein
MIRIKATVDLQAGIRLAIQIAEVVIQAIRAVVTMAVQDKETTVRMVIPAASIPQKASFCLHMQK